MPRPGIEGLTMSDNQNPGRETAGEPTTGRSDEIADAARAIARAWTDEGRSPRQHRATQRMLRSQWPALANAVERLAQLL